MALIVGGVMRLLSYAVSPVLYGAFGGVTAVLIADWIVRDAAQAFSWADGHGFLMREAESSRVMAVRENCPRIWLVTLHILLHPEIMGVN
ncbi:hypothetical protein [Paraburkholderia sp. J12]|uniref:hypothetical protein n=1 Tax=Paraburkholderia sp. J12 TaxID=2805432 RepID=UPI002ABD57B7|nr:hypothetical protein [Paraburkholderia sp. J12]